ncbi:glycoside hydrolase family 97 protein [Humibacillus xanthopallidus]|uniref:Alpha-glucosidase n=1 Tax=Humibacillus xanthopallidus TaxID=412689 RepID=A0A543HZL6_9MICO|nr:glycoside hydrolase family 97 protein [Humibacillus xanthopallidus]TQM63784.1 alpha-glucosidase [Humibacillus xanthopallidus]
MFNGQPIRRRSVLHGAAAAAFLGTVGASRAAATNASGQPHVVQSPDHRLLLKLFHTPAGLYWSIVHDGFEVVRRSDLGLLLAGDTEPLGAGVSLLGSSLAESRNSYRPPYGRFADLDESHNELTSRFYDSARRVEFLVQARAYNQGAALRFVLLRAPAPALELRGESTTVVLQSGSLVWASRDESDYTRVPAHSIPVSTNQVSDVGPLADTPVTIEVPTGHRLSLAESAREHYPRMLASSVDGQTDTLGVHLATSAQRGGGPTDTTFAVELPFITPWRTLTIGADASALVDNGDLVTLLGRENILGDTSWIRPGKAYRTGLTTAAGIQAVDLAVVRNLQYVHFDAGWYGPEFNNSSDATRPIDALDLRQVIDYGRQRDVGVTVYVNRLAAERQLDEITELYPEWGVAGIKFGFLREGTQEENDWTFEAIRRFGEAHLLVNAHDNLRPAGLERTLPNYITMEGVRGNEHFPTPRHNVALAHTRNLSGPMDYTICYKQSRLQTTSAHQLAMGAVYYSALSWLYWYASPTQFLTGPSELSWFDAMPTTWDESRALSGDVGEHVAIARRHGHTWFLGAMTNESPRQVHLDLSFLKEGRWTAHRYADGTASTDPRATPVVQSIEAVDSSSALALDLAPAGGQAIRFEPA